MSWVATAAIAGLGSAAYSSSALNEAGKDAMMNADLSATSALADRDMQIAEAKMQMANLQNEYFSAQASNIAMFSATRDVGTDRSVNAMLAKNEKVVAKDIETIGIMGRAKAAKTGAEAAIITSEGRATKRAYQAKAVGTLLAGIADYSSTRAIS